MSTNASELAREARKLIAQGEFVAARAAVSRYCESVQWADQTALLEAQAFLQWAVKTVAAMRSHTLLDRAELSRGGAYVQTERSSIQTWEIVT